MKSRQLLLIGLGLLFLLAACKQNSPVPTVLSTLTPTPGAIIHRMSPSPFTATETVSITMAFSVPTLTTTEINKPTSRATASVTRTSENLISISQLPPAQYILVGVRFYKNGEIESALGILDRQGTLIGKIAEGWDFSSVRVSPDQKSIVFLNQFRGGSLQQEKTIRLLDLQTGAISLISQNCHEASWSPDGNKLALGCPGSIKILEKNNDSWQEMGELPLPGSVATLPDETRMAIRPEQLIWSPDGQTIIYNMNYSSAMPDPTIYGPYVEKVSCLSVTEPCDEGIRMLTESQGLISPFSNLVWLVASNSLAITSYNDNGNITLIDLKTGQPYRQIVVSKNPYDCIDSIAGSQDSEMIAYELGANIYSLDVKGDSSKLIYQNDKWNNITVKSWLTIPYPVTPSDTYTITEAGLDLNLRADPSLVGESLRKLQPGDGVTVLEGPVTANGYTWWKLQTEDGSEGWAVNIPEWYAPAVP